MSRAKTYSVLVTERFVTRFRVTADSPEEATDIANERAINGEWEKGEQIECERDTEIEQ